MSHQFVTHETLARVVDAIGRALEDSSVEAARECREQAADLWIDADRALPEDSEEDQ